MAIFSVPSSQVAWVTAPNLELGPYSSPDTLPLAGHLGGESVTRLGGDDLSVPTQQQLEDECDLQAFLDRMISSKSGHGHDLPVKLPLYVLLVILVTSGPACTWSLQ